MLTVGLDVHQAVNLEHGYDFNGNLILLVEHPRTADFEEDYVLDNSDIVAFTAAFQNSESSADLNGDGIYDQADLNAFTAAFTGGPAGGFYTASFQYDQRNQLVGFTAARGGQPIKSSSYRYDCFNRRVAAIIKSSDIDPNTPDGRTAFFVYAGQAEWQLIEEYAAGDDMTADRSYVYGLYIDEVLSMRDQVGDDYYYHQDDLFSVYALTDDAGNVVERYAYGDYGQVSATAEDGSPRAGSAYGNTHAFTGRILCDELTLDDGGQVLEYRNRYLMTSTGRFVQRDPAGYGDGMNLYRCGRSNPLKYTDSLGLSAECPNSQNCTPPNPNYTEPSDEIKKKYRDGTITEQELRDRCDTAFCSFPNTITNPSECRDLKIERIRKRVGWLASLAVGSCGKYAERAGNRVGPGQPDKKEFVRHCVLSCCLKRQKRLNDEDAWYILEIQECCALHANRWGNPKQIQDSIRDWKNNTTGLDAAGDSGSCEQACLKRW